MAVGSQGGCGKELCLAEDTTAAGVDKLARAEVDLLGRATVDLLPRAVTSGPGDLVEGTTGPDAGADLSPARCAGDKSASGGRTGGLRTDGLFPLGQLKVEEVEVGGYGAVSVS